MQLQLNYLKASELYAVNPETSFRKKFLLVHQLLKGFHWEKRERNNLHPFKKNCGLFGKLFTSLNCLDDR